MIVPPIHAWVDGRLVRAGEPQLTLGDRSFQLGDGVFETLRARRGIPIELDEHLGRLATSLAVLEIAPPADGAIEAGIRELLDAEGLDGPGTDTLAPGDAAVRVTVSRGQFVGRGLRSPEFETVPPTIVIQAWRHAPPPDSTLERGVAAVTSSIRRDPASPLAGVKSTSRADHVFARLEAARAGADDALFLTTGGTVSEATSANLFAVVGETLVTPPKEAAILEGTTRAWLLAWAADLGWKAEARPITPEELVDSGEAFLTSSVAGIVPLAWLDGAPIGEGHAGHVTLHLREAREAWVDHLSVMGWNARSKARA